MKYFYSKNNENGWQTFLFHIQVSLWIGVVVIISFFMKKIQNNNKCLQCTNYRPIRNLALLYIVIYLNLITCHKSSKYYDPYFKHEKTET